MVSSSPGAHPLRLRRGDRVSRRMRRAARRRQPQSEGTLPGDASAGLLAWIRRALDRMVQIGLFGALPVDIRKRVRLCNVLALWGTAIMGPWVAVELLFGEARDLPSEIASLVGFLAVLSLNAARAHRAARLLLIAIANGCVLAGALLFDEKAGGTLPFFALAALPLLLFGPNERRMVVAGVALPILLFVACETGAANRLLGIRPLPAPSWWFAANVVSAFAGWLRRGERGGSRRSLPRSSCRFISGLQPRVQQPSDPHLLAGQSASVEHLAEDAAGAQRTNIGR